MKTSWNKKFSYLVLLVIVGLMLTSSIHVQQTTAFRQETSDRLTISTVDDYEGIGTGEFDLNTLNQSQEYDLDIVLVGFDEYRVDINYIKDRIPGWYAPIENRIAYSGVYEPPFDVNYTINYNFEFISNSTVTAIRDYMYSIAYENHAPYFENEDADPYASSEDDTYYIPSTEFENYLAENYVTGGRPTIFILDVYSMDPSGHNIHYYNSSSPDIDGQGLARPSSSQYQIAGGGKDNRVLWLDLSTGGSQYFELDYPYGVNSSTIPQVWDSRYDNDPEVLSEDIAEYLTTAIELKFTPSYVYDPYFSLDTVRFDFKLIDLDPSEINYTDEIKLDYITQEYRKLNPSLDWQYSFETYDLQDDRAFNDVLDQAKNTANRNYNSSIIINYLDSSYQQMFPANTADTYIVPVFLFAFEQDYGFDRFLGVAQSSAHDQSFSYILGYSNADLVREEEKSIYYTEYTDLTVGSETKMVHKTVAGVYQESLDVYLNVDSGSLTLHIMESEDWQDYSNSRSYQPLMSISKSSTDTAYHAPYSVSVRDDYYFVVESSGGAQFDLSVNRTHNRAMGFTFVSMHEIGHGLGLSHPHDGYTWGEGAFLSKKGYFRYWLWDMTNTQMTYADQPHEISKMDVDSMQRASITGYSEYIDETVYEILTTLADNHTFIPYPIQSRLQKTNEYLDDARVSFTAYDDSDNYNKSLTHMMNAVDQIRQAKDLVSTSFLTLTFEIKKGISVDYEDISYAFSVPNQEISYEGQIDSDGTLSFFNIPWDYYSLELVHDDETVYAVTGFTWQTESEIDLRGGIAQFFGGLPFQFIPVFLGLVVTIYITRTVKRHKFDY